MQTPPESLAFIEHAPVVARVTRELPAAAAEVFDALADAEGWERWFPGMRRCEWLTPEPYGVGSLREVRVDSLRVVERFIVGERPHRWGFTFADVRPRIARAGMELVELDDLGSTRSLVTYTMALRPIVPVGPVAKVATGALESKLTTALAGLERHVVASR